VSWRNAGIAIAKLSGPTRASVPLSGTARCSRAPTLEQPVADVPAEGVVELREAVDIDEEHRGGAGLAASDELSEALP
jgi:hypothetical protein